LTITNSKFATLPTALLYKIALRALGFNVRKAEVLKLMQDHCLDSKEGVDYSEFTEIGASYRA
jgi:Ca2+-binding EF-hand superfamily protein